MCDVVLFVQGFCKALRLFCASPIQDRICREQIFFNGCWVEGVTLHILLVYYCSLLEAGISSALVVTVLGKSASDFCILLQHFVIIFRQLHFRSIS